MAFCVFISSNLYLNGNF